MRTKNINIQKGTDTFVCSLCCKNFSSNGNLSIHIKSIHEGEKHKCDKCGKDFTSKWNLQNHVQKIHEKKKFTCSTCNAELSSKSILISHIIKKHKNKKISDNHAQIESNANVSLEDREKTQSIKVRGDC